MLWSTHVIQNARNAVSDNLIRFPLLLQKLASPALFGPSPHWIAPPCKKNLATGLCKPWFIYYYEINDGLSLRFPCNDPLSS